MSTESPSRKRKRAETRVAATESDKYTCVLSTRPPTELGPVVAAFPSTEPPTQTPFTAYYTSAKAFDSRSEIDFAEQSILLAGESKRVDFVTADVPAESGSGTRYLVALRSKSSKTLTIRDCPFHLVRRDVKRLKSLAPVVSSTQGGPGERAAQRSKLGAAFGTKKAIKALKARERNQVDVSKMEGVLGILGEGAEMRMGGLPTEEQAKEIMDSARPIPPYDPSASNLEDVYSLTTLIPDTELSGIRVSNFLSAEDDTSRVKLLPYARSSWINSRIQDMQLGNGDAMTSSMRRRLQILMCISSLFALRTLRSKISERKIVNERLKTLPQNTVEGLLKRFTETPRGSTKPIMTSEKETLILTTMFALTLHIDKYVVDTALLAKDLSMSSTKVNQLYKSLGCRIEVPNATECARLGVLQDAFAGSKRAILRIPLQFPKERSGKRKR